MGGIGLGGSPVGPAAGEGDDQAVRESVRQQFGAVAANYVTSAVHARGADLADLARLVAGTGVERVLDLGTAAGHAALAVAPHVGSVVGVDITPEMLGHARDLARERGLDNVTFKPADVEQLPFVDRSFDVVISRFSAHHWPNLDRALFQAARVLRPGGRFLCIDTVGPDDPESDRFIDTVERLRDPSHRRNWTPAEWLALLQAAGLGGEVVQTWDLHMDFATWVQRMQTPAETVARLNALMDAAPAPARRLFNIVPTAAGRNFSLLCALFRGVRAG